MALQRITNNRVNRIDRLKILILCCILILLMAVIFVSPIFAVKQINISGMSKFTESDICDKIGLVKGTNIFLFKLNSAKKTLLSDPYIKSVEIIREFPDTINLSIVERKPRGYVPYLGTYLYIDEEGFVLESQTSFIKRLPIVEGLDFSEFFVGEKLVVKNTDSFDVVVIIAQMMTKYNLLDDVLKLNAGNPQDIHIYVADIDVSLGNITDCDKKIRTMIEILKVIPEGDRGFLNLSDTSRDAVFKFLT